MSLIYEVTQTLPEALAERYRDWLVEHVQQMLALPGFTGARCFEIVDPTTETERGFCTQYELASEAALDNYLNTYASAMRADGLQHFGAHLRSTRRVLNPVSIR